MKKALLIIDVQVSSTTDLGLAKKIEKLQYEYDKVFISKFVNEGSHILHMLDWKGYENTDLTFKPRTDAYVYDKPTYTSYLDDMKNYDEIHICGYDTDACIYKTAMDLIENNIRPIILSQYCGSCNDELHQMGMKLIAQSIGKRNII